MFLVNTLTWCLINIMLPNGQPAETAATGVIKQVRDETLVVDFSLYAYGSDYIGDYSNIIVSKDICLPEEEY